MSMKNKSMFFNRKIKHELSFKNESFQTQTWGGFKELNSEHVFSPRSTSWTIIYSWPKVEIGMPLTPFTKRTLSDNIRRIYLSFSPLSGQNHVDAMFRCINRSNREWSQNKTDFLNCLFQDIGKFVSPAKIKFVNGEQFNSKLNMTFRAMRISQIC